MSVAGGAGALPCAGGGRAHHRRCLPQQALYTGGDGACLQWELGSVQWDCQGQSGLG